MFAIIRTAFFLASRNLRRSSKWVSGFVIFIITLTFLNLVVINGILVGIIVGSSEGFRDHYSGEILLSNLDDEEYIQQSNTVISIVNSTPHIIGYTERIHSRGQIFKEEERERILASNETLVSVGAEIIGVDPSQEDIVTELSNFVVEGAYLERDDDNWILLGAGIIDRYSSDADALELNVLKEVYVGDRVYVRFPNGFEKKYRVRGVIRTKNSIPDLAVFLTKGEVRKHANREFRGGNIAIRLDDSNNTDKVKQSLLDAGAGKYATVETSDDIIGALLEDIRNTFAALGFIIGLISLTVAVITLFIIIFITAIQRRKFIGIMKGVGVAPRTIILSYVMLALFYVVVGIGIGLSLLQFFIAPYFAKNPIDFPFSDGVLYAPADVVFVRVAAIIITSLIAAYIPARIVAKKNTLDAIVGR